MPTAFITGLTIDADRRIKAAQVKGLSFESDWSVSTIRTKSKKAGIVRSQLELVQREVADHHGGHILLLHGEDRDLDREIFADLSSYFRVRWLEPGLLKLIPHEFPSFFESINLVLREEMEWHNSVKPKELSGCLLLPECAFACDRSVQHLWKAAREPGLERIRAAAKVVEQFRSRHWLPSSGGARAWVDDEGKLFDHRGPRHGKAPFPRDWKFSYQIEDGFHYDVKSADQRAFYVTESTGTRHKANWNEHVNIDSHGYVR